MLSNRVKRNIWLTLTILSALTIIDRTVRVVEGSVEWWNLLSAVIVTALCGKFFMCYRKQAICLAVSRCSDDTDWQI